MPSSISLFIPGRLCLAGEHSDWAATYRTSDPSIPPGSALVLALHQGIHATVTRASSNLHLSSSLGGSLLLTPDTLLSTARSSSPWRFAAGVAFIIKQRYDVIGLSIVIDSASLRAGKGLSSSAAVCVLVARGFNKVYGLGLSVAGEMDVGYAGERLTGSACGRMDQIVAIGAGRVARMTFDGELVEHCIVEDGGTIWVVLADLGKGKDTGKILAGLNKAFGGEEDEEKGRLREALGQVNLDIVDEMESALEAGDGRRLGELMVKAQLVFDEAAIPFCKDELEAPGLHAILADQEVKDLVWGGKGVGSQGDGTVQFVAKDQKCADDLTNLLKRKLGTDPYVVQIGQNAPGHDITRINTTALLNGECKQARVRTAVIPAAGFGTRLFPASRSIRPKALFPIIDADGFAKPLLLYLVEQCAEAGITRVIIVVGGEEQEERVREVFSPVPNDLYKVLKPAMRAYADRVTGLSSLVEIAMQKEPNGFGDAVACARVDEDCPFVLLLGDVVFKSAEGEKSCLEQAIAGFEKDVTKSVIGVTEVDVKEAGAYGVVRMREGEGGRDGRVGLVEVVEKPNAGKAEELSHGGKCWGVLGPYVFTPTLMKQLRRDVEADRRDRGEIQLTSAMADVLEMEGLDCLCLKGEALDTGNADEYVKTIAKLGAK